MFWFVESLFLSVGLFNCLFAGLFVCFCVSFFAFLFFYFNCICMFVCFFVYCLYFECFSG